MDTAGVAPPRCSGTVPINDGAECDGWRAFVCYTTVPGCDIWADIST